MIIKRVGGKSKVSKWIATNMPPCDIFVDVFGGSGAVLDAVLKLRGKNVRYVYNDMDEKIYHFFKMLQGRYEDLARLVELTPYSRQFFNEAFNDFDSEAYKKLNDLDKALCFLIVNRQSFGAKMESTWSLTRDGEVNYETWGKIPNAIRNCYKLWKKVFLENADYREILRKWDSPSTSFYLDPPYEGVEEDYYDVNKEEGFDHHAMFKAVRDVEGSVCVSYYGGRSGAEDSELLQAYDKMGCQIIRQKVTKHLPDSKEKTEAIEALIIKPSEWAKVTEWTIVRGRKCQMQEISEID